MNDSFSALLSGLPGVLLAGVGVAWVLMTFLLPFLVWDLRSSAKRQVRLLEQLIAELRRR